MRNLIPLLVLAMAGCSSTTSIELETSNTSVELDAYSGLPNPTWQLTVVEAQELERKLEDLPPGEGAIPDHLGYRGFQIRPQEVRLYGGIVVWNSKVYRDVHGAEAWLLAYAQRRGVTVQR